MFGARVDTYVNRIRSPPKNTTHVKAGIQSPQEDLHNTHTTDIVITTIPPDRTSGDEAIIISIRVVNTLGVV